MRAVVLTLGTGNLGEDIVRAVYEHCIVPGNPDAILVLGTSKSLKESFPFFEALDPSIPDRMLQPYEGDAEDVDKLFRAYIDVITRRLIRKGYAPREITADFTSGTKPMSAALTLAAVYLGLDRLSYVSGDRGEGGRVISGTERPILLRPGYILLDHYLTQFERLFDAGQFQAAGAVLDTARESRLLARHERRMEVLVQLTRFYASWDRYDLGAAVEAARALDDLQPHEHLPAPLYRVYKQHRDIPGRLNHWLHDPQRIADLVQNGLRRLENGNADDAAMRLYRAIEFAAQVQLKNSYEIEAGDVEEGPLPDALQEKYAAFRDPGSDRVKLPMVKSYELLSDLGDAFGGHFMKLYAGGHPDLQRLLNKRNNSILAHGFEPVKPTDVEQLYRICVEELLPVPYPNIAETVDVMRFPKFTATSKTAFL